MALKQAGKTPDARALFEGLAKQFPDQPAAAQAIRRAAQCRREELTARLDVLRQNLAKPGITPDETAAAERGVSEAVGGLRDVVSSLETQAGTLGGVASGSDAHLWTLYETAWSCRTLAEVETEMTRRRQQQEAVERVRRKLAAQAQANQPAAPAIVRAPEYPPFERAIPVAERTAMEYYGALIAVAADKPIGTQTRLELAELNIRHASYVAAERLLGEVLSRGPGDGMLARTHVLLAEALLGKQDPKSALAHAETVAANAAHPLAAYAKYLTGEALCQQQAWNKAIDRLVPFRDQPPFQNVPDVSDRALLRLGQAYLETSQWDACRQTMGVLAQRFPLSALIDEALYDAAWSWQRQAQYDPAVDAFRQVTGRTASEWGARAQLQIGLCRMEQKRWAEAVQAMLSVPLTYDYPQWQAAAYCEAGRAYLELKQPQAATAVWERVVKNYGTSPWAQVARQRLVDAEKQKGAGGSP